MSVPESAVVDANPAGVAASPGAALLDIQDLVLDVPVGGARARRGDTRRLLHGISLSVAEGETVGLVGESGSGKSLTARTVLGLVPERAITSGRVVLGDVDVLAASAPELRRLRRRGAAMIFQDPRAGINPMRTIGDHLTEALRLAEGWTADAARERALALLAAVRLPRPEDHLRQFPHELSGGMLQRIMIAGALTTSPRLLVCDEPTTALDVTTQAEIIGVLAEQRASRGMGMLFITHDLNLAASLCDRVYVMNDGVVVEQGPAREVLRRPSADYTRRLVAATPTIAAPVPGGEAREAPEGTDAAAEASVSSLAPTGDVMLAATAVSKTYVRRGKEPVRAVIDASISVARGSALGVVGESGSGKSTLARIVVGLETADAGEILVDGRERAGGARGRRAPGRSRPERLAHARSVQMVFQDPYLSLDPRIPAGRAIEDALRLHTRLSTADARTRVLSLLDQVGLTDRHAEARPRTLSGGQRQRVAIARALAIEPDVLVMDEATSALDVSVQAQVLDLVDRVRTDRGLTVLFISHDLAVVRRVCEHTVVMRRGEIVERGRTGDLLAAPQHPYTRLLIDSVPKPGWDAAAAGAEAEAADPGSEPAIGLDDVGSEETAAAAIGTAEAEVWGQAR